MNFFHTLADSKNSTLELVRFARKEITIVPSTSRILSVAKMQEPPLEAYFFIEFVEIRLALLRNFRDSLCSVWHWNSLKELGEFFDL